MTDFVNFVILSGSMRAVNPNGPGVSAPTTAQRLRRRVGRVAAALTLLTLAATVLAAFASRWWFADLAVHFRPQYAAVAALAALGAAAERRWAWAGAALAALALNVLAVVPALEQGTGPIRVAEAAPASSAAPAASAPAATRVRLLAMNVFYGNTHYERVRSLLQSEQPDAAVLVEITPQWVEGLQGIERLYPYRYYASRWRGSLQGRQRRGVLLLSRWPIAEVHTIAAAGEGDPSVDAALEIGGRRLRVIGVHASWPMGPRRSAERNAELEHLGALAAGEREPLVIAGDLNITPFSPRFQRLLEHGGLHSAASGWAPTWPTFLPPAGIRIDHVLVSPRVTVLGWRRGPGIGSDHWPVVAELAF